MENKEQRILFELLKVIPDCYMERLHHATCSENDEGLIDIHIVLEKEKDA